jgi:hypothetical protein
MPAAGAKGARVIVPLQRGAMSTAAFVRAAAGALGFGDFVPGIPSNKDAMPAGELEDHPQGEAPPALRLLGLGARSPRLPLLFDVCHRLVPSAGARATATCSLPSSARQRRWRASPRADRGADVDYGACGGRARA